MPEILYIFKSTRVVPFLHAIDGQTSTSLKVT